MKNFKNSFIIPAFFASLFFILSIFQTASPVLAKGNTLLKIAPPKSFGSFEGSLSYPGETIPAKMSVCAENIKTKIVYCNHRHLKNKKYRFGLGFKLTVPVGQYKIFAIHQVFNQQGQSTNKYYRAYQTAYTACGQTAECLKKSHLPLIFEAKSGKTIDNINDLEDTTAVYGTPIKK